MTIDTNLRLGLTGGIGSGKSTVSAMLSEAGFEVVDADFITREVHQQPDVIASLVAEFGRGILDTTCESPRIVRSALAKCAFSSSASVAALNRIMHPALHRAAEYRLCHAQKPVVLDAALLFEAGWDKLVDVTMVVLCSREVRMERVIERDGLSRSQIESRMASQMSDAERCRLADIIIYNTGSLEQLCHQMQVFLKKSLINAHEMSIRPCVR